MSSVLTFVDSNVLVYAHDATDGAKQRRAETFVQDLWNQQAGVLSTQVLAELYSVLVRKLGVAPVDARRIVTPYGAWRIVELDSPMLAAAMLRNEQDAVAWWDCLIVEAALRAGALQLATEDLQSGRVFDGSLRVVDPMAA